MKGKRFGAGVVTVPGEQVSLPPTACRNLTNPISPDRQTDRQTETDREREQDERGGKGESARAHERGTRATDRLV